MSPVYAFSLNLPLLSYRLLFGQNLYRGHNWATLGGGTLCECMRVWCDICSRIWNVILPMLRVRQFLFSISPHRRPKPIPLRFRKKSMPVTLLSYAVQLSFSPVHFPSELRASIPVIWEVNWGKGKVGWTAVILNKDTHPSTISCHGFSLTGSYEVSGHITD